MTLRFHIQLIGGLLVALALAHGCFGWYFGWDQELRRLSLLTRRIFQVHNFFIALVVGLLGIGSLFGSEALLAPNPSSRMLLSGAVIFWCCRLIFQFAVYDRDIWKGRRLYTVMHGAFSVFWAYAVAVYALALRQVVLH